jgi:hypothetical protein
MRLLPKKILFNHLPKFILQNTVAQLDKSYCYSINYLIKKYINAL